MRFDHATPSRNNIRPVRIAHPKLGSCVLCRRPSRSVFQGSTASPSNLQSSRVRIGCRVRTSSCTRVLNVRSYFDLQEFHTSACHAALCRTFQPEAVNSRQAATASMTSLRIQHQLLTRYVRFRCNSCPCSCSEMCTYTRVKKFWIRRLERVRRTQ